MLPVAPSTRHGATSQAVGARPAHSNGGHCAAFMRRKIAYGLAKQTNNAFGPQ